LSGSEIHRPARRRRVSFRDKDRVGLTSFYQMYARTRF
jgi:hypothetical protein